MSEFDIEKYLNSLKEKQKQQNFRELMSSSIDTQSLFTDRNEIAPFKYSKSEYPSARCQTPLRITNTLKPYNVEDFFPKSPNYYKSLIKAPNKENIKERASSVAKRDWDDKSAGKDSFRNPMISVEHRTSRSPSPHHFHDRRSTADFQYNLKELSRSSLTINHMQSLSICAKKQPKSTKALTICTCILSGSIYSHKHTCKPYKLQYLTHPVARKFSVLDACVFIQRQIRRFLLRKCSVSPKRPTQLNCSLFSDLHKAKSKQVISSVLSSFAFNQEFIAERYAESNGASLESQDFSYKPDSFLDKMILSGNVLKNCRSDLEESIDFELSGSIK